MTMSSRRAPSILSIGLIGAVLFGLVQPPASAAPSTVTFEADAPGLKPNGFMSAESSLVQFFDSVGTDLEVADFGHQSHGKALVVYDLVISHHHDSELIMKFTSPLTAISLAFGNDDPTYPSGSRAVLTVYNGGTQVGQVSVEMNRNDLMDQTISFSGALFDSATFEYVASAADTGLLEIVDDIVLTPATAPSSREECKDEGWKVFSPPFKNQGDCVSFVATQGRNPADG